MNDPRVTREGLNAIPLEHLTYLKAKARGENSMSGKADKDRITASETAEDRVIG
jgi:hypothetical protein